MQKALIAALLFCLFACDDSKAPKSEGRENRAYTPVERIEVGPGSSASIPEAPEYGVSSSDVINSDELTPDVSGSKPVTSKPVRSAQLRSGNEASDTVVSPSGEQSKTKFRPINKAGQPALSLKRPSLAEADKNIPLGMLPSGVTPLSYALALTVDPAEEQFSGHVDIAVALSEPTDRIYMHGDGLAVSEVSALLSDGQKISASYSQIHVDGVVRLDFERPLDIGNVVLEFDYAAAFGRLLHGLYKVNAEGESYAFTQMESIYAREAFPSFDEPSFKTPFEVSLIVRGDHQAIANAPEVESSRLPNGMKRVRFAATPPMTTYLFAIAVGPLDIVEGDALAANTVRKDPLPFRGVAIKGKGKQLAYAMKETGSILVELERYFNLPYPYAKLDIIAVPDFEAGAMENIGAITFREKLLLLKKNAPPQQKRAYASVMAHELAHMWFGNLVTMPWWDDIWLNESFATWMSYKAVEAYDVEQKAGIAQLKRTAYAMEDDGLISARQIREPVLNNDDIVAAFDGITYSKGGAVLNMFEQFIGEDVFRDGVRAHMVKFAHGNATVLDLMESLSVAANRDLSQAANSFLFQNGIPLVEARLDCENKTIELSQSRFLPLGSKGDTERTWDIPLCLKYAQSNQLERVCVVLEEVEQSVDFDGDCPDWVLPNADFAGYFHWVMPATNYAALLSSEDLLTERELLSVADSTRAGFASGRLDVAQTWEIIEKLASSKHPSVARSVTSTVQFMTEKLGSDNPKLLWAIRGRAAALYKNMRAWRGFDATFLEGLADNETRIHYSDVASFMAEIAYDQETRSAALAKARVFLGDEGEAAAVSRSTLDTILTVGVQDGGQSLVDALYKRFASSRDAWFRDTALSALARTRDYAVGKRLREDTLKDGLRSNEIRRLFLSHMREDVNVQQTWDWLTQNIDELIPRMPAAHATSLSRVASRLCDTEYLTDLEALLRPRLEALPGGARKLDNALEELVICAATVKLQIPQARAYFSSGHNTRAGRSAEPQRQETKQ
ncbi:MAG: M1 family aminopeptidase [Gammaproteobacteria bacterium]